MEQQLDLFAILAHVEKINPLVLQLAMERTKNDALEAQLHEAQHAAEDEDNKSEESSDLKK